MGIAICILLCVGSALFICGQAIVSKLMAGAPKDKKKAAEMRRGATWCINLSYLMAVLSFLLILACGCCRAGGAKTPVTHSDYE